MLTPKLVYAATSPAKIVTAQPVAVGKGAAATLNKASSPAPKSQPVSQVNNKGTVAGMLHSMPVTTGCCPALRALMHGLPSEASSHASECHDNPVLRRHTNSKSTLASCFYNTFLHNIES